MKLETGGNIVFPLYKSQNSVQLLNLPSNYVRAEKIYL